MAKGQQSGLNSITVWMILFVGLWLTSTVFLVILYTGQEDLNNENTRLLAANSRLITPAQERSIQLAKSAKEGGPTVVGLVEEARGETAELASGNAEDNAAAIRTKRDQILRSIQADAIVSDAGSFVGLSYHEALSQLYTEFKAEHEQRRAASTRATDAETRLAQLVEDDAARKDDFDRRTKETSEKLGQCESDRSAYRDERDKAMQKVERDLDETRRRSTDELTGERQLRLAAEQRLAEVQERFAAQQEKLGGVLIGPEYLATARQPDGRILTAVPGDSSVYIDLGAKHTLTLGLQFGVYAEKTGIPPDGRAKAQIEVVSISPVSAECRIVSVAPNAVILEGDLIANPIYDPANPPTFLVLGEFDINRDGLLDRRGNEELQALINHWGGKTVDELTPLTDFVVLGAPPRRPRGARDQSGGGSSAWTRYNELADSARTMSVPIMTQDVFLNFLGYSGRYARR